MKTLKKVLPAGLRSIKDIFSGNGEDFKRSFLFLETLITLPLEDKRSTLEFKLSSLNGEFIGLNNMYNQFLEMGMSVRTTTPNLRRSPISRWS